MKQKDIKTEYRRYKFFDKVPLIPKDEQWLSYFDGKFSNINVDGNEIKEIIEQTLDKNLDDKFDEVNTNLADKFDEVNTKLDDKFDEVNTHIDDAKDHLCCDICCSKNEIKKEINNFQTKFDAINFEDKFSDLNEQAERIIAKLESLS